ncbi:MAG TPA: DUF4443 domain-containing protein [Candidatus Bathyarchaeia archaeon]|nr:DUF4443 domain-containing protein [Candidatus Bathyarchaeia archaeon]
MVGTLPEQKEALLLLAIQDKGYLGRYKLVSIIGLPDGVTRGLLIKLARKGYVKTKKFVGRSLTPKGKKRLTELLAKLNVHAIREIDAGDLRLGPKSVVAHIRDGARSVRSGIEQRDAAIKAGAAGAITVIYHDGKFLLPPDRFDISEKNPIITERFRKEFELLEGDALVIGSGADKWRAVEGVLAAAETLR